MDRQIDADKTSFYHRALTLGIAMPIVEFAAHLRRHIDCPPQIVTSLVLQSALEQALAAAPGLRAYVFDDQDALRAHVAVFVNGERIASHSSLKQPLAAQDRIYVVQALSGG